MATKAGTASELMRGSLDLMVLSVLSDGRQYGYALQARLRESSGGSVDLKAGTLYPLLHRLEAEKLIKATWDAGGGRKRKWYELTAKGRQRLTKRAGEWYAYADCLTRLLRPVVAPPESFLNLAPRPAGG